VIIAVDFDGVIVNQDRAYDDLESPLQFNPGAREALLELKAAGHLLILWSGRLSSALLVDPMLDPLVKAGKKKVNLEWWRDSSLPIHQARAKQMLDFISRYLPGVFDAIDDGAGGKPSVDLFIDDRAIRFGVGPFSVAWDYIGHVYGERVAQHS
jgi:hypothetical protein